MVALPTWIHSRIRVRLDWTFCDREEQACDVSIPAVVIYGGLQNDRLHDHWEDG